MSNRTYSQAINDGRGAAGFMYIYDASYVTTTGVPQPLTGAYRPYTTADISNSVTNVSGLSLSVSGISLTGDSRVGITGGFLNVTLTGFPNILQPLPISGVVQAQVTLGNLAITGFNSTIPPLAVSGNFATNAPGMLLTGNSTVAVTGGFLNVALTGFPVTLQPVPISGVVQAQVSINAIAVTGFNSTIQPLAITGFVNVANQAIINSGGFVGITGFSSLIQPLAISGIVTTAASNVAITGFVNVTGNVNSIDTLGNLLLSGISGQLAANLAGSAPISGDIRNIPGTVLAISGVVLTVISGTTRDRNPVFSGINSYPSVWVAGRAANPSGIGSATGYNTGDAVIFSMDAANGSLFVTQGALDKTADNVTAWAAATGVGPVTALSGAAPAFFGVTLPNNPNRRGWFISMIGTGVGMVKMSATIPTTGTFDFLLKGATTPFAGDGASYSDSPCVYSGPVSITGFGGAPIVWRAWEV